MSAPPWEHIPAWRNSRSRLLELLAEAVAVRNGVAADLPEDDVASRGYVFFRRWVARVVELAGVTDYWSIVHGPRGVIAIDSVPLRLYRAPEDAATPAKVLQMSEQESDQLTIFDIFGVGGEEDVEPEPEHCLRLRTVTDELGKEIVLFVFEELATSGRAEWSWSISARDLAPRMETPLATQAEPDVQPRKRRGSAADGS